MRTEDRQLVAQLCAARAGLLLDPERSYFIESRLGPVARREGFASIIDMLRALRESRDDRLAWAIVESLGNVESAFFGDRAAIDTFAKDVLPALAEGRDGAPIRVWSAACGAGQEVYSLAMAAEEQKSQLANVTVELFASDLSQRALDKAQSGLYTQFEVQRGLPIRQLIRHFEKRDEMWSPSASLRQMIRWRRTNLAGDLPTIGPFEVIFCRNLLPSLIPEARAKVIQQLVSALAPGGYLFLDPDIEAIDVETLQPAPERAGLYARPPAFQAAA
jgi:chemotaxis protein methyltransferase CheR